MKAPTAAVRMTSTTSGPSAAAANTPAVITADSLGTRGRKPSMAASVIRMRYTHGEVTTWWTRLRMASDMLGCAPSSIVGLGETADAGGVAPDVQARERAWRSGDDGDYSGSPPISRYVIPEIVPREPRSPTWGPKRPQHSGVPRS